MNRYSMLGLSILLLAGCSRTLDWGSFPCDPARPCMSGYYCNASGVCVEGTAPTDTLPADTGADVPGDVKKGRGLKGEPKLAMLYVGPIGDHGWTKTHDDGRLYVEQAVPGLKTTYAPSISAADAPAQIDKFISEGANIVIGTSFDFLVPVQNKAANYPDVNFLICSGFITSPNMGSYFGRMYTVKWMAGKLAAKRTKTKRIGYVAPVPIPEVVRHINAFTEGVRSVDPTAVVIVKWVYNWFDVAKEPVVTKELVDAGADVVLSATDTTIPLETAVSLKTKAGDPVYTIGYDNIDSCAVAAKHAGGTDVCLASAYYNWGPMLKTLVQQMKDGAWDPSVIVWDQIKTDPAESVVNLNINTDLVNTADAMAIQEWIPKLAEPGVKAQALPFPAPVKDNTGKVRLKEGYFQDEDMLRMCWFVDGVIDVDAGGKDIPAVVPSTCVGDK
jgi:basic membrane protein A